MAAEEKKGTMMVEYFEDPEYFADLEKRRRNELDYQRKLLAKLEHDPDNATAKEELAINKKRIARLAKAKPVRNVGWNGVTDQRVVLGEVFEVSTRRGNKLLKNFPKMFRAAKPSQKPTEA